eukprot:12907090-Prorocentrum_lima.AAC.1
MPEKDKAARKRESALTDRTNTSTGPFRQPHYHRRGRVPPGKLRKVTDHLRQVWEIKRDFDGKDYFNTHRRKM